jgi:hypothetical protein
MVCCAEDRTDDNVKVKLLTGAEEAIEHDDDMSVQGDHGTFFMKQWRASWCLGVPANTGGCLSGMRVMNSWDRMCSCLMAPSVAAGPSGEQYPHCARMEILPGCTCAVFADTTL